MIPVLREPTTAEFQKAGFDENGSNNLVQLAKLFPLCVVESSFEKEDGTKLTGKEIYDLHKHWQERFHPFRVEHELPTN